MIPPYDKPPINNLTRVARRDPTLVKATVTPLRRNSNDNMPAHSADTVDVSSHRSRQAGVPIPGRKSSARLDGSEKLSISVSPPRPPALVRTSGKLTDFDEQSIVLPVPMGSSPPRSPPAFRLSHRPSDLSTTVVGEGSASSSPPQYEEAGRGAAKPTNSRKTSGDQIGLGPCPPQTRAPGQAGASSNMATRDQSQRVPGGSWPALTRDVVDEDHQSSDRTVRKQSVAVGTRAGVIDSRPIPKIDTRNARQYSSPLAQSPLHWSRSDSGEDASSRISLCVSSLAPSRRNSTVSDVDAIDVELAPIFRSYARLHGAICRREYTRVASEAKSYSEQLERALACLSVSAGSITKTSSYDAAVRALIFSQTLMTAYLDKIEKHAEDKEGPKAVATAYQLMEMSMSNLRNLLQTIELEQDLLDTETVVSEFNISLVASDGHEGTNLLANRKVAKMRRPSLFDRLRKVSLGCIRAFDSPGCPTPPATAHQRRPSRASQLTRNARTSVYTPTLASEDPEWDYTFVEAECDGDGRSLSIRASLALFPEDVSERPDFSPILEDDPNVVRGTDGSIIKATVKGLIRVFTDSREMVRNDMSELIDAFFLFFLSFTTSETLFNLLIERYEECAPPGLSKAQLDAWEVRHYSARIYVVNLLSIWLESHWKEVPDSEVDEKLLTQITAFVFNLGKDKPVPVETPRQLVDSLLLCLDKRGRWLSKEKNLTETNGHANDDAFQTRRNELIGFMDHPEDWRALDVTYFHTDGGPEEIARQLTMIESELFHRFQPQELIHYEHQELQKKLGDWKSFSDALSLWVMKSIVEHDGLACRVKAMTVFIATAAVCKSMRNYNSALAILLGLRSSPVLRLQQTEQSLLQSFKDVRSELEEFFDARTNWREYRAELPINLPTIPLAVVMIKDIKLSREILPRVKSMAGTPSTAFENLIPLQYYRNMRRTVRDLAKGRGEYKSINKTEIVYNWLKNSVDRLKDEKYELYIELMMAESRIKENKMNSQSTC